MDHPRRSAPDLWAAVSDDAERTAAGYRSAGWEVLELHPETVAPHAPADGPPTLAATVPDGEFAHLRSFVAGEAAAFDTFEAYRASEPDLVSALLAVRAPDRDRVVLVPLYYSPSEATTTVTRARDSQRLRVAVLPETDAGAVVFDQVDADGLFPPEEGAD
jgi:hypothetical protein